MTIKFEELSEEQGTFARGCALAFIGGIIIWTLIMYIIFFI